MIGEEKEEINSANHEKEESYVQLKKDEIPPPSFKQDVSAKVTYTYPKGNFRFPIIPDEEQARSVKRVQRETNVTHEDNYIHSTRKVSKKSANTSPSTSTNRSGFRPTEIPSPIYGFGPRDEKEGMRNDIIHEETHSSASFSFGQEWNEKQEISPLEKIEDDELIAINEHAVAADKVLEKEVEETWEVDSNAGLFQRTKAESINKNTDEITSIEFDEDSAEEFSQLEENVEMIFEEESVSNEPYVEDEIEEKHIEEDPELLEEEDSRHEEIASTTIKIEDGVQKQEQERNDSEKAANNERKAVPYNVLMFGRDKRKLQQREGAKGYQYPSLSLLAMPPAESIDNEEWVREQAELLDVTLHNFNVRAKVVNVTQGPAVTRLEVQPEPGVKVSKITNLTDDIKLSLSARDIRIEAPIPGKNTIGIEVPNPKSKMVLLREILRSPQFVNSTSPLTVALGLDISGAPIVTDLKKMPHGLIAGATGSGKSVCINTMLVSLLYKATPQEVKLLLIDPKMVELAPYNHIPHLVSPVITDVKAATQSLKWAVEEMERRYELFAHAGVRDISRYNEQVVKYQQGEKLPYIVVVIDELADLMMVAPGDVEEAICRIAQKARACGIHLLIATQRPSVDVITGLIKANVPTRIAFSVSSQVDSRTIIDTSGAERLLGKGDMLFLENGSSKAVRIQGNFVSDEEIERVVEHARNQGKPQYLFSQQELLKKVDNLAEEDELFHEACEFVVEQGGASTSSLQRRFRIGYNRAARLMDLMEEQGIISESKGSKPRDVLVTEDELHMLKESSID